MALTTETYYHLCSNRLPHQFSRAEQQRRFPTAAPAEKLYGEADQTPAAELADPVPLLERRLWDSTQSRVMSKPRRRGCTPADLARQAPDAEKVDAEVPFARHGPADQRRPDPSRVRSAHSLAALVEDGQPCTALSLTSSYGDSEANPAQAIGGV